MKYKLFISDYDGTLGGFEGIDLDTVKAIKEYEKRGGKFVVCTGRMYKNVRAICEQYDIADVVVSYQGARINERKSGKLLFAGGIDSTLASEVLRSIESIPVKPAVLSETCLYYSKDSFYIDAYKKANIVELKRVKNLAKEIENGVAALKINVICDEYDKSEFIRIYGEKFKGKLIVNSGGYALAEFVNPACSKGASVRFLADYYNIKYDEIIAVGDSTNDIELISGGWHGVAVGDGDVELKKYANEISVDYKNQPVKFLLEKYCL